MITVSSITKNTDRDVVIHTAFLIFLQTLLSIYHIMLLAICTTQVKKRVKKENKKKRLQKIICFKGIQTRTSESVRTKN